MNARQVILRGTTGIAALALFSMPAAAQLGRQQGLVEPNVAADSVMTPLPGMTADIVAALKSARPILGPAPLDSILNAKGMAKAARTTLYAKLFVHVDLNRGTDADFMLIPGMDARKLSAIKAKRPYADFASFTAEVTKVANAAEADRLEQYVFIPIELNTHTEAIMDTFAGIGVGTRRWKREFVEYRPWTSMEQFDREIGKYVRANPTELQRLKRYVYIK
ncbi:MAG: hypothetical protein FJ202_00525 [Gemmatimonadetes bacterium]|nr:hypothetical protein [Gemmatimonadota bacterium]